MLGLDGGGSRGLVLALVIEDLEKKLKDDRFHDPNKPKHDVGIWQLFDMVVGEYME